MGCWQAFPGPRDSVFLRGKQIESDVADFARELFTGAAEEVEKLDGMISGQSQNWRVERMAAVDRNLLRIALYEILHHPETPPPIIINEALEIARRFSGDESVEFVNGILDGIKKSLPAAGPAS
jgi:transcription antitermination protein NusB